MSALGDAAERYARAGWAVFQLAERSKSPRAGTHAHLDAVADPIIVRSLWAQHPDANIGWRPRPEWLVIDVDPRNGGEVSMRALAERHGADRWPSTLTQRTPTGGWHLVYQLPAAVQSRVLEAVALGRGAGAGRGWRPPKKLAAGVDVKHWLTGYIAVAPSVRVEGSYEWVSGWREPAPLPEWALSGEERRAKSDVQPISVSHPQMYAAVRVESLARALAACAPGDRNNFLNTAAFISGTMAARGWIAEQECCGLLMTAALRCGLGENEAQSTIRSGFTAGLQHPIITAED